MFNFDFNYYVFDVIPMQCSQTMCPCSGDFVNWARNISQLADEVSQGADETSGDLKQLHGEVNDTIDRISDLENDLRKARKDIKETSDIGESPFAFLNF